MNTYKNTFLSGLIVFSAFSLVSCNQSAGNVPVGSASINSADTATPVATTDTGASTAGSDTAITGAYVALSAAKVNVSAGDTFTLDITANDFLPSEGGGVTLFFDQSVIEVTAVTVDNSVWDFVNRNGTINNHNGTVSDIVFSSYQGVSGNAKIATVEFKSLKQGTSQLTLTEVTSNPFASNGMPMSVAFKAASVVVE